MQQIPDARESEKAVIGGLMQAPEQFPEVLALLKAEDFRSPAHAAIFELMRVRVREGRDITMIGMADAIGHSGTLDLYGGSTYAAQLAMDAPPTVGLSQWVEDVRQASVRRKMLDLAQQLVNVSCTGDPRALVFGLGELATGLAHSGSSSEDAYQVVGRVLGSLQAERDGETDDVTPTGITELDDILSGGVRRTETTILAGRPAMGKTAVAMNLATNFVGAGRVVGILSLEMSKEGLMRRALADLSGVTLDRIMQPRQLDQDDWDLAVEAHEYLKGQPLYICDKPGLNVEQVIGQLRAWKALGLDIAILDHLEEMDHGQHSRADLGPASTMQQLKDAARDLGIHLIALTQLNRKVEERANKRPMRSDLKSSGKLEEAAYNIVFVYRDAYYNPDNPDGGPNGMELIVAKNRSGRAGTAHVHWEGCYQRVRNLGDVEDIFGGPHAAK